MRLKDRERKREREEEGVRRAFAIRLISLEDHCMWSVLQVGNISENGSAL